jgi:hypothetical protein
LAGGTLVTITGSGFTGASNVLFGTTPATSFTFVSDTQITATSPAAATASTVDVKVVNPLGTSATGSGDKFAYTTVPAVSGVSPATGETTGGTSVTITGSGFTGTTSVLFGTTPARSFTVVSDTQVTATSPATTTAGTVDVTVVNPLGTSPIGTPDKFTYVLASATLSGYVYLDASDSGQREMSSGVYHPGVPGVPMTLSGTDSGGNAVSRSCVTGSDGSYDFGSLPAGTYKIQETQLKEYNPGKDTPGLIAGATVGTGGSADAITNIALPAGQNGTEYDFCAWGVALAYASEADCLASTPLTSSSLSAFNSAPVLNATATPTLTPIAQGNQTSPGNTVSQIVVDGSITDADYAAPAIKAVAVTSVDNQHGDWQYANAAAAAAGNWQDFTATRGAIVDISAAARLLEANDSIRFVPDSGFTGQAVFTFRAWDETTDHVTGAPPGTANLSNPATSTGGHTAYSTATNTASITVSASTASSSALENPLSAALADKVLASQNNWLLG